MNDRARASEGTGHPAYRVAVRTRTNAELVHLSLEGGPEGRRAWNELVEVNSRAVWKVLWSFRMSPGDRDDVFQSTWLRALERLGQLREPDKVHVWLMTIARHEAENVLRRSARLVATADPPDAGVLPVDSERLENDERYRVARAALDRLGDDCRTLIRMLTVDDLTYREIESLMGWSPGGTAIRRSRCLERVRRSPEIAAYLRELDSIEESREQ